MDCLNGRMECTTAANNGEMDVRKARRKGGKLEGLGGAFRSDFRSVGGLSQDCCRACYPQILHT